MGGSGGFSTSHQDKSASNPDAWFPFMVVYEGDSQALASHAKCGSRDKRIAL